MKNPKNSPGYAMFCRLRTSICLTLLLTAPLHAASQPSTGESPRTLYVVEYVDSSQVTLSAYSDLRPDLNRSFENGDKARWYLTQKELNDVRFQVSDYSMAKWYRVAVSQNSEWITLGLKPARRMEKLTLTSSIDNLAVKVHAQNTLFHYADPEMKPPYPPSEGWQPLLEAGMDQHVYLLLDNDGSNDRVAQVPLTVELPWGHEFASGERSQTIRANIAAGEANRISLEAKRLPLIPLFYIDYSESMPTQKVREMIRIIRTFDDKAVVGLGHDGRIVHQTRVSHSNHENWKRLNQYLNRHPTIGYASLARNEISQFVNQIQQIQFGFWRNQFAIPILILSSRYQNGLSQHEFDRWVEQINKLHQDKLIKKEIIVIIMGNQTDGEGLVAADYQTHFFSWSSRELRRELSELLHNLSSGSAL